MAALSNNLFTLVLIRISSSYSYYCVEPNLCLHPFFNFRDRAENSYPDMSVCYTIKKLKLLRVLNFVVQYQCIYYMFAL